MVQDVQNVALEVFVILIPIVLVNNANRAFARVSIYSLYWFEIRCIDSSLFSSMYMRNWYGLVYFLVEVINNPVLLSCSIQNFITYFCVIEVEHRRQMESKEAATYMQHVIISKCF